MLFCGVDQISFSKKTYKCNIQFQPNGNIIQNTYMYIDISSTIYKTKAKCYFYFILLWAESKYSQLKYITYNCIFSLKSSPMEYHSYIYISHYDILQN